MTHRTRTKKTRKRIKREKQNAIPTPQPDQDVQPAGPRIISEARIKSISLVKGGEPGQHSIEVVTQPRTPEEQALFEVLGEDILDPI